MKRRTHNILNITKRLPSLFLGLFLFALGLLATKYANLGMSPWDVFHMGVVNHTPLTFGQASQLTGLSLLLVAYFMGITPGLGSVCNMFFVGFFIDIVDAWGIFYYPDLLSQQVLMLLMGILLIGWGSYFYLRVGLGAGPRDGLMEGLVKKSRKPVWSVRGLIEVVVFTTGFFLGGPVGVGTVVTALTIGFSVQLAFKLGRYDAEQAVHLNLAELFRYLHKPSIPPVQPMK